MISAPVTGPEPPGGGRLAVPSSSIVCSLTVAETSQKSEWAADCQTRSLNINSDAPGDVPTFSFT